MQKEIEEFKKRLPCFLRVRKEKISDIADTSLNYLNLFVATDVEVVNGYVYVKLLGRKNLYLSNVFEVVSNWLPN